MRRLVVIAVMAPVPILASSAGAATLELQTRWVDDPTQLDQCGLYDYSPDGCYGWYEHYLTYTAGAEHNNLTLGGEGTETVLLRDPNVPISVSGADSADYVDGIEATVSYGDPFVPRGWDCSAPQGHGNAMCLGSPGTSGLASFDRLTIVLGGGDDKITLLRGSMPAHVFANSGNDTIDSRNNTVDRVVCGTGVDTVVTDGPDAVAADCENVTRGLGLTK
jgi:hypothetical protein